MRDIDIEKMTRARFERLVNMGGVGKLAEEKGGKSFLNSLVFFVNDEQAEIIERAVRLAARGEEKGSRAKRRTGAVVKMCRYFVDRAAGLAKVAEVFVEDE